MSHVQTKTRVAYSRLDVYSRSLQCLKVACDLPWRDPRPAFAGIMSNIFDGIQRPLKTIAKVSGDCFIPRGINVPSLDVVQEWEFRPTSFKVSARCIHLRLLSTNHLKASAHVCALNFEYSSATGTT